MTQRRSLSISQIAIWSESSHNLSWSISTVLDNVQNFRRSCQSLQDLYDAENIQNMIIDGDISYSPFQEEKSKGMSFDVRYVIKSSFRFCPLIVLQASIVRVSWQPKFGRCYQ